MCREKSRAREARRREEGRAHYDYDAWRARRFARAYGITLAEYDAMFEAQDGKCFLCGGESNGRGRLAVDHDHVTGVVRGLLCFTCNTTVGAAERLGVEKIRRYLQRGAVRQGELLELAAGVPGPMP